MPVFLRQMLERIAAPLRHDPAWFELASIMGAIGWAILGLFSSHQFDDWPSMRFISVFIGNSPPYVAMVLGLLQAVALFAIADPARSLCARKVMAFAMAWGWLFMGLGIARTLPGLNPHVALYVVMAMLNWMVTFRLGMTRRRGADG